MTQRDRNSIGLIGLILMMMAFFVLVSPMFRFSIPRMFMHDWLGLQWDDLGFNLNYGAMSAVRMIPLAFLYMLWASVAIWVYRDAERRNVNGMLWALFVFVGNIIGLIIYLIVRSSSPERESLPPDTTPMVASTTPCPECGRGVQASFVVCPYCAHSLARSCVDCGERLEIDWKACPHCGRGVEGE